MRSRFEIIQDILLLANGKQSKTSILREVNLSYNQLQEYFSLLLDANLLNIHENDGKTCYKCTSKGYKFLKQFQEIQDFLSDNEEQKIYPNRIRLNICYQQR